MSQMGIGHDDHQAHGGYHQESPGQWMEQPHSYHGTPQHQSPVNEYPGFGFTPMPMEPMFPSQIHQQRAAHHQLQPLIMPQWPSMLTSQSNYAPPIYPSAPVPVAPASTPVSATSTRSSSTPRKTLTDQDRRRMCLYHEEHPTVKQTEIGAMFGVERSTVSKVLRQKEKYLYQDDGSRSPIKRAKGKFPDIERALSNWARNHQKQGLPLSDNMIKEKARFFATTVGSTESHSKVNSTSWLEKFKQKNNLMGAKSRKGSIAEESETGSNPDSSAQTPGGISPISPTGLASPSPVAATADSKFEEVKSESPRPHIEFSHRPFHSQSNNSLSSVFTDGATTSTYSAGPTSPNSPFFTPDSANGPGTFMPPGLTRAPSQDALQSGAPPGSSNFHRPRSQTFPMLGIESYGTPPASSEPLTPKYATSGALASPISEIPPHLSVGHGDTMQPSVLSRTPSNSMQPPPVPTSLPNPIVTVPQTTHYGPQTLTPISPDGAITTSPSQEEARRALEIVMSFFQHQPNGFVDPQEFVTIGKLMEKLRLQRTPTSEARLPGGLHTISETGFAVTTSGGM